MDMISLILLISYQNTMIDIMRLYLTVYLFTIIPCKYFMVITVGLKEAALLRTKFKSFYEEIKIKNLTSLKRNSHFRKKEKRNI